jgi:hypothetical protein
VNGKASAQEAAILIALAAPLVSLGLLVLVPAIWILPDPESKRAISHWRPARDGSAASVGRYATRDGS